MDVTEIIWRPDPEAAARTRMGRFMAQHGLATLEELQRRSIAEPEWYWDAVSRDLGFHWFTPYRRVLDESQASPGLAGSRAGGSTWPTTAWTGTSRRAAAPSPR